jgi:hypothetical protein
VIEFTGCYSTRILTTSEITPSDYYLIHSKKSTYLSYNDTISDGILSGKLDFNNKNFNDPRVTHIFLSSDSLLTINNDQISLPVNSVKEIKQRVHDPGKTKTLKTVLIVAACIGAVTGLVVLTISLIQTAETAAKDTAAGCSDLGDWAEEMYLCSPDEP